MAIYAATIFLSALLLFQVQLIIAKHILPWFGGTATVWTTCLLFFQVVLTAGYAYSHRIVERLSTRSQSRLHLALLAGSIIVLLSQALAWTLPLLPQNALKPTASDMPILRILALLALSVGLPFFVLSTTSSLLQVWFTRQFPGRSPYRLYALSNAGSLIALLSYPFLVEPNIGLRLQAGIWTALYLAFVSLCALVAIRTMTRRKTIASIIRDSAPDVSPQTENPTSLQRMLWLALPAVASTVLLATTNHISEEFATVPFLWVLPLTIYLLTFILCFSSQWFYSRGVFVAAVAVMMILVTRTIWRTSQTTIGEVYDAGIIEQMSVYYFALFVCCMLCHGELVKLKPPLQYLTRFYLTISIGGASGGFFVAIIAPLFFQATWELYIGYFACGCAVLLTALREPHSVLNAPRTRWIFRIPAAAMVMALGIAPFFLLADRLPQNYYDSATALLRTIGIDRSWGIDYPATKTVAIRRNFYGIVRVVETQGANPARRRTELHHGQTIHGFQFQLNQTAREVPTTYYSEHSGIGLAIQNHAKYLMPPTAESRMTVGLVGLGAGTLAAYGRPGDNYKIYEINPAVVELATEPYSYFSFIDDSKANIEIVLGDARISMEREEPQKFDILAIDAFCGDTPPVHLLTAEAFAIYLRHMNPTGVIAIHISNRYLDFRPVVYKLARQFQLEATCISSSGDNETSYDADWMLLTRDKGFLRNKNITEAAAPDMPKEALRNIRIWTDDYTNLYQLLR
ncbi:MAG: hypothetical protein JW720_02735 [Sedimentisphaerales bacterium]|nr:hypothetical protein [Sedimentisphaerales bacterium]